MQNNNENPVSMGQNQKFKAAASKLQSTASELKEEICSATADMRSFGNEIGSDFSMMLSRIKNISSDMIGKAMSARRKSVAADIAEGAAALKDNADAHGEDIRRAVGLTKQQADAETTPEEVAALAGKVVADIAEGAAALKDNADAHGEDIRRAVGLTKEQAEAETTPEEVAALAGEVVADFAEGAAALKDNADAHGEDIRRAVGLTKEQADE